jgi:hypothetical protein
MNCSRRQRPDDCTCWPVESESERDSQSRKWCAGARDGSHGQAFSFTSDDLLGIFYRREQGARERWAIIQYAILLHLLLARDSKPGTLPQKPKNRTNPNELMLNVYLEGLFIATKVPSLKRPQSLSVFGAVVVGAPAGAVTLRGDTGPVPKRVTPRMSRQKR